MATNLRETFDWERVHREWPATEAKARMRWEERDGTGDVAKVHLFLASGLANYVSGETVVVDGGMSVWNGT